MLPLFCLLPAVYCLLILLLATPGLSAPMGWAATYGGGRNEHASSIQQTSDGGYIVAGNTDTFGAGRKDIWVLKLRPDGTVEWQKAYGGADGDTVRTVLQTSDGGYIMAGNTGSFAPRYLGSDLWVLKLKSDGSIGPSCDFIRDTSISGKDSSATAKTTSVSPKDSEARPRDSQATTQDTNASARFLYP